MQSNRYSETCKWMPYRRGFTQSCKTYETLRYFADRFHNFLACSLYALLLLHQEQKDQENKVRVGGERKIGEGDRDA